MKTHEFLILISAIITGVSSALIINYQTEKDPGKQGIVYACIFGVGIGVCIFIEALNMVYNS